MTTEVSSGNRVLAALSHGFVVCAGNANPQPAFPPAGPANDGSDGWLLKPDAGPTLVRTAFQSRSHR